MTHEIPWPKALRARLIEIRDRYQGETISSTLCERMRHDFTLLGKRYQHLLPAKWEVEITHEGDKITVTLWDQSPPQATVRVPVSAEQKPIHAAPKLRSREARQDNAPRKGSQIARIVEVIRSHGCRGATFDEVEAQTGISHQSASANQRRLREGGWIVLNGDWRRTRAGSKANVYVTPEHLEA